MPGQQPTAVGLRWSHDLRCSSGADLGDRMCAGQSCGLTDRRRSVQSALLNTDDSAPDTHSRRTVSEACRAPATHRARPAGTSRDHGLACRSRRGFDHRTRPDQAGLAASWHLDRPGINHAGIHGAAKVSESWPGSTCRFTSTAGRAPVPRPGPFTASIRDHPLQAVRILVATASRRQLRRGPGRDDRAAGLE